MLCPKFTSLIFLFKKLTKYFVSMKPLFDVCIKLIQKGCLINYDDIPNALFQIMTGREKSHFDDTAQSNNLRLLKPFRLFLLRSL